MYYEQEDEKMAPDFSKIEAEILKILSKDFEVVSLRQVNITPDQDFDGDEILRVEVVFDGKPKDLPLAFLTQATRRIRPTLNNFKLPQFPSITFTSSADAQIAAST